MFWTQDALIKALFLEEVPEVDAPEIEPTEPIEELPPEEIDEMTAGWHVVVSCTSGPMGTYNRSDMFFFSNGSRTTQVVWKPGQDNGIIAGEMSEVIDRIIIELWQWDMTNKDHITYSLDELVYVTASGETIVQGVNGVYETNMSGGTGDNTITSLRPYNLKLEDIVEIRATVTFIELTTEE